MMVSYYFSLDNLHCSSSDLFMMVILTLVRVGRTTVVSYFFSSDNNHRKSSG